MTEPLLHWLADQNSLKKLWNVEKNAEQGDGKYACHQPEEN